MKPTFNRVPLVPNAYASLPLGSIHPEGWLLDQLKTQAEGLSGRLYDIWEDVGPSCGWLGGEGDGWERAPYYLDGLIPLAWALEDDALKARAQEYVEWILQSQREDGWFGPSNNDDHWPRMVALKALIQYFSATNDKRVLILMDKFFKYQHRNLDAHPLKGWAVARGAENMQAVLWLYNLTGQKYLLELAQKLKSQTLDWTNEFHTFPHTLPMSRSLKWSRLQEALQEEQEESLEGTNRPYFSTQYHFSHVVNVAMGLKNPGVVNMFKSGFKEQMGFKVGWEKLMKSHGVAYGLFTGDEHLNGPSPVQGTETCAVVEAMYSLESLLTVGDFGPTIPDLLEKLAFNALPAAFTPDMLGHQYDQQANQVKVSDEPRPWYNNGSDSNVYGFAPNFGCCTANYHQGWPKFVASMWLATPDEGLFAVSYAPCTVRARLGGVPARLRVSGGYPFGSSVEIEVSVKQPAEFPLYLRMPGWAVQPMIYLPEGEIMQVRVGETTCVRRRWRSGDVIKLEFPMQPRLTHWYHQSVAVELGPLLMAFQPKEKWTEIGRDHDIPSWQVEAESPWNWAIVRGEPMKSVQEPEKARAFGKGEPACRVLVKAARVEWGMNGANAQSVPIQPEWDPAGEEIITLVPYGGTGLRISQFPICGTDKG